MNSTTRTHRNQYAEVANILIKCPLHNCTSVFAHHQDVFSLPYIQTMTFLDTPRCCYPRGNFCLSSLLSLRTCLGFFPVSILPSAWSNNCTEDPCFYNPLYIWTSKMAVNYVVIPAPCLHYLLSAIYLFSCDSFPSISDSLLPATVINLAI